MEKSLCYKDLHLLYNFMCVHTPVTAKDQFKKADGMLRLGQNLALLPDYDDCQELCPFFLGLALDMAKGVNYGGTGRYLTGVVECMEYYRREALENYYR